MVIATASIIKAAEAEWDRGGNATWNCITGAKSSGFHIDDETAYAQYIIDTYCAHFYKKPIKYPTTDAIGNDDYYWSAVAISHMMLTAGFKRKKLLPTKPKPTAAQYNAWVTGFKDDEFPASEAHADYIRWSIRARDKKHAAAAYWGYRVDEKEAVPEVGDLVGYGRGSLTKKQALALFDATSNYSSHTDIVVAKRKGEIDVIGGNVRDSVTRKTLAITAKGLIADTAHRWFVVMKKQ